VVPTAPASVPPTPAPAIATQPSEPVAAHLLVGVLELGNRSAALFEINGVSQRVYIGERIGNSGWSLVSVSSDEAVIRRNGEVRSIYIGQKF
jgi:Tfp pilus assembly protein PilP